MPIYRCCLSRLERTGVAVDIAAPSEDVLNERLREHASRLLDNLGLDYLELVNGSDAWDIIGTVDPGDILWAYNGYSDKLEDLDIAKLPRDPIRLHAVELMIPI